MAAAKMRAATCYIQPLASLRPLKLIVASPTSLDMFGENHFASVRVFRMRVILQNLEF